MKVATCMCFSVAFAMSCVFCGLICMSFARTPTQQGGEAKGFSLLMPTTH